MKLKKVILLFSGLFVVGILFLGLLNKQHNSMSPTELSSTSNDYESMSACEKQEVIWEKINQSNFVVDDNLHLPELSEFSLREIKSMFLQNVRLKRDHVSDFAPQGWVKYLHSRGSIAKVKIVPVKNKYTGLFKGAECALLRLSLTYKPLQKLPFGKVSPVAPGLALKIFRNGQPSANVSALVSLDGQGEDFNFFAKPMSNIVPVGDSFGHRLVSSIFKRVSNYPEELKVEEMARVNVDGQDEVQVISPRQIFFKPNSKVLKFSSAPHDTRNDFSTIPSGTKIYSLYAVPDQFRDFEYNFYYSDKKAEEFLEKSVHIADLVTNSEFIASEFGDSGIFFRHQVKK